MLVPNLSLPTEMQDQRKQNPGNTDQDAYDLEQTVNTVATRQPCYGQHSRR